MATTNQDYELMLIYTPVLTDEEFKSSQNKVQEFIKNNGGEIVHSNPWGLRSLAYPIEKKTTGLYYILEYKAPTDLNAKLLTDMNRDEQILRHLITSLDKYAVEYNETRRNGKLGSKKSNANTEATAEANNEGA